MILEQVTLRDFCLFSGEQSFDLTPVPALRGAGARGIILFGGVNGAGKTTFLDAIQLALYGSRARCSKRTGLTYDEFLRKSIHHGVNERQGASVSLSFRYASGGEEHVYDVRRAWSVRKGKVREELLVTLDGLVDRWHSDNWGQLVEDFFPMEVSQLFFFDAEKIRSLAEDETSSQILGSAVKSLLGLDLAERLIADASVLETRLAKDLEESESRDGRAELDREIESLGTELDGLRTTRAELENNRRRTKDEVERLEEEFKAAGGKQWEARGKRKRRQEALKSEVADCENLLAEMAAKELPLCLVDDLIESVERQDEQERVSAELDVVRQILIERDEHLLAFLDDVSVPRATLQKVKGHLAGDRKTRTQAAKAITARLGLSPAARVQLQHLRGQRLAELRREAERSGQAPAAP